MQSTYLSSYYPISKKDWPTLTTQKNIPAERHSNKSRWFLWEKRRNWCNLSAIFSFVFYNVEGLLFLSTKSTQWHRKIWIYWIRWLHHHIKFGFCPSLESRFFRGNSFWKVFMFFWEILVSLWLKQWV